jgi:hypothetical protein
VGAARCMERSGAWVSHERTTSLPHGLALLRERDCGGGCAMGDAVSDRPDSTSVVCICLAVLLLAICVQLARAQQDHRHESALRGAPRDSLTRIEVTRRSRPLQQRRQALRRTISPAHSVVMPETMGGPATSMHVLQIAQTCFVEAGFRHADCTAIVFVVLRRAARARSTFTEMLWAYSALDADTARAAEVRAYPWGNVPGKLDGWNRHWAKLRAHVTRIAAGEVRDPCPGASHWGGRMDRPRGRMVPVRCSSRTENRFYRVMRWRTLPARLARGVERL